MARFDLESGQAGHPHHRSYAALAIAMLVALALALTALAVGVQADVIAPVLGSISLGPLSLSTTIENRICLQRAWKVACRQPVYTLKLGLESAKSLRFYSLARLPISERYAYYP